MSLLSPVKEYCERTSSGVWGEPLNAVSNVAFFIAAFALYKLYQKRSCNDYQVTLLICIVALVGCGSTLFHTFANGLTMIFDVVPIALFTFYYLWLALRRLVGLTKTQTGFALVLFVLLAYSISLLPADYRFNGSADYFSCLITLLFISIVLTMRNHASARWLLYSCACFALSLSLRSLDFILCPTLPMGTHFLWHICNAVVLYLLVKTLIKPGPHTN